MRKTTLSLLAALTVGGLTAVTTTPAFAEKPSIYTPRFNNIAVDGHDPVAYFKKGAPTKGSKAHELEHDGAVYRFESAENLEAFKADPATFAPQFGGYCAWAVSQGYTARGNPDNWTIRDGKLYLNYNDKVQKTWLTDPEGFIELASANWPSVLED